MFSMKNVIFGFVALTSSSIALAEVKPMGYVLEQACGQANEVNPRLGGFMIVKACTASVVGKKGKYVVIVESAARPDGAKHQHTVWKVTRERPGRSGVYQEVIEAGYIDKDGILQLNANTPISKGTITKSMIANRTTLAGDLMGRKFNTATLEVVYHTQSVDKLN